MHAHAQFHLQQSEVVRVREIALNLPQDVQDDMRNVTQLIASKDGLYIYALTPRKVKQHYNIARVVKRAWQKDATHQSASQLYPLHASDAYAFVGCMYSLSASFECRCCCHKHVAKQDSCGKHRMLNLHL